MPRRLIAALVTVLASVGLPSAAAAAGDNIDTPGVVRQESGAWGWWLSNDFNANVAYHFQFGSHGSTPLVGDWDGDGDDAAGVNVGGNHWILGNANDGSVAHDFVYGDPGDVPLVGDWDGDGDNTIAIRRDHCFHFNNQLDGSDRRGSRASAIPATCRWSATGTATASGARRTGATGAGGCSHQPRRKSDCTARGPTTSGTLSRRC